MWGYGARGSACRSSPSSHSAINPRSATGEYIAALVPTTTVGLVPEAAVKISSHRRYRCRGPNSDVRTVGASPTATSARATSSTSRWSGTTTIDPRPLDEVDATAAESSCTHVGMASTTPGSALHAARGELPTRSAPRKSAPLRYRFQSYPDGAG